MKQMTSTIVTVAIILSGTALMQKFYKPWDTQIAASYELHFPGDATDRGLLELEESQRDQLLQFLNDGSAEEISGIDGIATVRGEAIRQARPFRALDDIHRVDGIGEQTVYKIIAHAKSGF